MQKQINVNMDIVPALDEEKMKTIASQLRCPNGEEGKVIGELLHSSNIGMIKESINILDLMEKNRILELGHGSCCHLEMLLSKARDLKYFGMEISEVMKLEAEEINSKRIKKREALFQLYNGVDIDYVSNFFDRVLTVNTIYFIENPLAFLNEMYRVLKPGGKFVISFVDGSFMKELPFVVNTDVFDLYDDLKMKRLIDKTDFIVDDITTKEEKVVSKTGENVNRNYVLMSLSKKKKKSRII